MFLRGTLEQNLRNKFPKGKKTVLMGLTFKLKSSYLVLILRHIAEKCSVHKKSLHPFYSKQFIFRLCTRNTGTLDYEQSSDAGKLERM